MIDSAKPPANGENLPGNRRPTIKEQLTGATSQSPVLTSSPTGSRDATTTASEPSKDKRKSHSRPQPGKRQISQARATIAVAYEMITGALDKLPLDQQTMAVVEGIRRLTRRLETITEKIIEEKGEQWLER